MTKVEIAIPFPGFYNSVYSDEIDQQGSQWAEHAASECDGEESEYPEPLRLDESKLCEILFRVTNYSAAYHALARDYVESFSTLAGEALGISAREKVRFYSYKDSAWKTESRDVESLRLTFADMESPREYNFTTDRIFARIPVSVIRKLWAISKAESHDTLSQVARERFTSRDGFISHYRADWREWGPLSEWDVNQLETLLIAVCEIAGFDWEDSDLGLYYATVDGEAAYQAWESAVDWQRLDAMRNEARAEKLAEWLADDTERASAWIGSNAQLSDSLLSCAVEWPDVDLSAIPYRCAKTPDPFA